MVGDELFFRPGPLSLTKSEHLSKYKKKKMNFGGQIELEKNFLNVSLSGQK